MMEVNKEQAERCIEYAERFIFDGKRDKAEKLLLKAERLFPTQKAKDLLEQLKTFQPQTEQEGEPRKRHVPKKESYEQPQHKEHQQHSKPSASGKQFNKEHLEAVERIVKCKDKDHYVILGVSKKATNRDIRKAYKKLALQLHPDKNKCPGAAEAFKAIGNAVAILTDPEKRKQYEERLQQAQRHSHGGYHEYNYTRGFEGREGQWQRTENHSQNGGRGGQWQHTENHSQNGGRGGRWQRTENHSQNGGGGGRGRWQHTENHSQNREQQSVWYKVSLLWLFLIFLPVMSMYFFTSDPIYNLQKSSTFPVQRKTRNLKVPYFVNEDFHLDYKGRRKLEKSIDEEYVERLQLFCLKEKSNRQTSIIHAYWVEGNNLIQKARNLPMPSCDKLHDIEAQAG